MSYFKKSHAHKPKKGQGSYDREVIVDPREIEEAFRKDDNVDWPSPDLPPVNQKNLPSADDFYKDR